MQTSNEQIVAALLSNGTKRKAAEALGIDEKTIYNRMQDGEFQAMYKTAKADYLRATLTALTENATAAAGVVAELMNDRENNPAVRLQAAQTILNATAKYAAHLRDAELNAEQQIESNKFFNN